MTNAQPPSVPASTHLLYLHGFRSSPLSFKAQKMAAWVRMRHPAVVWWCPQLPPSPLQAMRQIMQGLETWPVEGVAVVGSSLGGFYATCVAERRACRAVLLNPAVEPARDLARYIGKHTAWHPPVNLAEAETFYFEPHFVDELRELHPGALQRPEDYFAVIAKGDEVLDWREMAGRYAGGRTRVLEGGDHALSSFETHLPEISDFLNLLSATPPAPHQFG